MKRERAVSCPHLSIWEKMRQQDARNEQTNPEDTQKLDIDSWILTAVAWVHHGAPYLQHSPRMLSIGTVQKAQMKVASSEGTITAHGGSQTCKDTRNRHGDQLITSKHTALRYHVELQAYASSQCSNIILLEQLSTAWRRQGPWAAAEGYFRGHDLFIIFLCVQAIDDRPNVGLSWLSRLI